MKKGILQLRINTGNFNFKHIRFETSISWTLNLWSTYFNGLVVLLSISLFPHLLDFSFFRHPNHFGLPDNQRIIDPKKGPVKKVAAVRKLPKLDSSGSGGSKSPGNSPRNSQLTWIEFENNSIGWLNIKDTFKHEILILLTLDTLRSVCLFFILFSIHFMRC